MVKVGGMNGVIWGHSFHFYCMEAITADTVTLTINV